MEIPFAAIAYAILSACYSGSELARSGLITVIYWMSTVTKTTALVVIPPALFVGACALARQNARRVHPDTIALVCEFAICLLLSSMVLPNIITGRLEGKPSDTEAFLYIGLGTVHLSKYVLLCYKSMQFIEYGVVMVCVGLLVACEYNEVTHLLALFSAACDIIRCAYFVVKKETLNPIVLEIVSVIPLILLTRDQPPAIWMFFYLLGVVFGLDTAFPEKQTVDFGNGGITQFFVPNLAMIEDKPAPNPFDSYTNAREE